MKSNYINLILDCTEVDTINISAMSAWMLAVFNLNNLAQFVRATNHALICLCSSDTILEKIAVVYDSKPYFAGVFATVNEAMTYIGRTKGSL